MRNKILVSLAAVAAITMTTAASCDIPMGPPTKAPVTATSSPTATATATPPAVGVRPFFTAADWLWNPVPASPTVDPKSAAVASALSGGSHVLDVVEYGVTLRKAADTDPRVKVKFSQSPAWGAAPHAGKSMPLTDVKIPPGGDKHYSVIDPKQGTVFALYGASNGGKNAVFGSAVPINGDGTEPEGMTSTGSRIARHAGVVTEAELKAGAINHTMFFSSNQVGAGFRYPALKTDQKGSKPGQEGMRIYLPAEVDISGLTGYQKTIAIALKKYGAIIGDGGGATVALIAEYTGGITAGYKSVGVNNDYASLDKIPWGKIKVIASNK